MQKEKQVLFGIDDSDFSKQALLATGELLKNIGKTGLTIFHGAPDFNFALLSKLTDEDPSLALKSRELWFSEARKVLERAKDALLDSGFDPGGLTIHFEENCKDPAVALYDLASRKGIETVAVARWGKETVSRQLIGSVTYRLAQLAGNRTIWVIDPRICSHNVLVCLVGASIGRRVVDYAVRHFSPLKNSRFTLFNAIPPVPPQCLISEDVAGTDRCYDYEGIAKRLKEYAESVREIAEDAKKKLVDAGVPEQNVVLKIQPQKRGIARDILVEMEEGNHGILVVGRKGSRDIKEFELGSKASKLLLYSRAFIISLVH